MVSKEALFGDEESREGESAPVAETPTASGKAAKAEPAASE
jgi:hypothetical protein